MEIYGSGNLKKMDINVNTRLESSVDLFYSLLKIKNADDFVRECMNAFPWKREDIAFKSFLDDLKEGDIEGTINFYAGMYTNDFMIILNEGFSPCDKNFNLMKILVK